MYDDCLFYYYLGIFFVKEKKKFRGKLQILLQNASQVSYNYSMTRFTNEANWNSCQCLKYCSKTYHTRDRLYCSKTNYTRGLPIEQRLLLRTLATDDKLDGPKFEFIELSVGFFTIRITTIRHSYTHKCIIFLSNK